MTYQYDVFVSYSSADSTWAKKLEQSLRDKGLQVFLDRTRLIAGSKWEMQLKQALTTSRHLVAVWTTHGKSSDWVQREIATFEHLLSEPQASGRKLIFLNLEAANKAYASYQQIDALNDGVTYARGADNVDASSWKTVIGSIEDSTSIQDDRVPVPLVIFTLIKSELASFHPQDWDEIAAGLGLGQSELVQRYGERRDYWRPLDGASTVRDLLDELRDKVNLLGMTRKFRWEPVPDEFWQDIDIARSVSRQILASNGPFVVAIDPVALYRTSVYQRLMFLQSSLESDRAVVLVLPPFAMSVSDLKLRKALRNRGAPYFDPYFDPSIPPSRRVRAQCGLSVGDRDDIQRILVVAVGPFLASVGQPASTGYLGL